MANKTMVELQALVTSLFPDNVSGSITPAQLRQFCADFVTSMTPAYGGLKIITPTVQVFNIAPTVVVWGSEVVAQAPQFSTAFGTGAINRLDAIATTEVSLNVDVIAPNGVTITATLYVNGVATAWRAAVTGGGAGRPMVLSLDAINYEPLAALYQIFISAETNATSVTLNNGVFLCHALPVRTA